MNFDFEDYLEEVKFQMTEYDKLTEEMILDWEDKVREWVEEHQDKSYLVYKSPDDIIVKAKTEEHPETVARLFYRAVRDNALDKYWDDFELV